MSRWRSRGPLRGRARGGCNFSDSRMRPRGPRAPPRRACATSRFFPGSGCSGWSDVANGRKRKSGHLRVGHEYDALVPPGPADVCEPDAGVPRGPFYHGPARFESVVHKDGKQAVLLLSKGKTTNSPWVSASLTTPSAARSFTLPPGFWNSALPKIREPVFSDRCFR